MYLNLIPIQLRLTALVTLEIPIIIIKIKIVVYKKDLWRYTAPTISTKMFDNIREEEDESPPEISNFMDEPLHVSTVRPV